MSYREKTAWVTLTAILIVSAMFFLHGANIFQPNPGPWELHMLGLSVGAFILIEVVAYLVLYLRNPKDARTPRDEREQLIDLKATRLAARVYVVLSLLSLLMPIHGGSGFAVAFFVVMAFVIAEIVNYSARIIYYRRGS